MKQQAQESVVQDWVHRLPFMMQALLLTSIRGADGVPKENTSKAITRYIRGAVLKPAGEIYGNEDNFMWIRFTDMPEYTNEFFADTDGYPMHFLMHLIHAAEVIGYAHPDVDVSRYFHNFYVRACHAFHMNPETQVQLFERLTEKENTW